MELRDGAVWDGDTQFAALESSTTPGAPAGAVTLRPLVAAVLGRDLARALVDALGRAEVPVLDVSDELVRYEARAAGWTGALRAPLLAPIDPSPIDPSAGGVADPVAAVGALLPGVDVSRRGFGRHLLSLRATAADGLRMKVKVPDRPDVSPELLAAALDTAVSVRRRFGRMAAGVHTISIDDGAGTFDDHSTLGSAQSGTGTFFLDTSLACADSIDAQRVRMAGRRGVSARTSRPWFTIDGVVAHEYWHNLDTTVAASPSTYVAINAALGAELGVDTFEHALRGREAGAPPEWQLAFRRIVEEVSAYATTNMREATAELFKLWWCADPAAPPAPLVACFGALLEHHFPPRA